MTPSPKRMLRITRVRPALALVFAICASLLLLKLLHSEQSAHLRVASTTPTGLSVLAAGWDGTDRAVEFAAALHDFRDGRVDALVRFAATCTPRDVADALLREEPARAARVAVLDVGANGGYPVTRLGLERNIGYVLSVEPDPRNLKRLYALKPASATRYMAVHGAISDARGAVDMAFHAKRNDFTCIGCLNAEKPDVHLEKVDAWTLDGLLLDDELPLASVKSRTAAGAQALARDTPILLLKTDTQGHERQVLGGASRLLQSGRVENVMLEFDPKLLRTKDNALATARLLLDLGMRCVHLRIASVTDEEKRSLTVDQVTFGGVITPETVDRFYQFVLNLGKYTDLFCTV